MSASKVLGSSPTQAPAKLKAQLPAGRFAVAFSGGLDSSALLHLAAQARTGFFAIHVHHGLQAAADAMAEHCTRFCERLSLECVVRRVQVPVTAGHSLEAQARHARYIALAQSARELGAGVVLLAQHANDQAESVLLALSRGAGLPGLAAMPPSFERHGMRFERPFFDQTRAQLRAYAQVHQLDWFEDPMNSDPRYVRVRLRQALQHLEQLLPGIGAGLGRSAGHAAQAQALLAELAAPQVLGPSLSLKALLELSDAQQSNVLRYWLAREHATQASAAQLAELQSQIKTSQRHGAPARLELKVGAGKVFRARDALCFILEPGAV